MKKSQSEFLKELEPKIKAIDGSITPKPLYRKGVHRGFSYFSCKKFLKIEEKKDDILKIKFYSLKNQKRILPEGKMETREANRKVEIQDITTSYNINKLIELAKEAFYLSLR